MTFTMEPYYYRSHWRQDDEMLIDQLANVLQALAVVTTEHPTAENEALCHAVVQQVRRILSEDDEP